MKILHIANGFTGSSLYKLFFIQLSKYPVSQSIFIPVRKDSQIGIFNPYFDAIDTHYCKVVTSFFYRFFFNLKIRKEVKLLSSAIDVSDHQIIHSHTLFSDGAVAYKLFKEFNIPYIIAVRNTDLNVFLKYFIHLRGTGKKIIQNSEKIVFLSKWYKKRLMYYYRDISDVIEQKSIVIPNGIDEYWYKNIPEPRKLQDEVNLVFAGEIRRNKNIHGVVKALDKLATKYRINFTIVGEGLNDEKQYLKYLKILISGKANIKLLKVVQKEELIQLFKEASIFIMPSFRESFGLVYAEALSQNLPVIYTQKEGFDEQFSPGEVGYPVDPFSEEDIARKILAIVDNYEKIQKNISQLGQCFSWSRICENYYNLYSNIVRNGN